MPLFAELISLAVGSLVMLTTPAYLILQISTVAKLPGGWRTAALAPLVPAAPLVVWCAYALSDKSNLWPMPFLLFAPFGFLYLLVVWILARRSRKTGSGRIPPKF